MNRLEYYKLLEARCVSAALCASENKGKWSQCSFSGWNIRGNFCVASAVLSGNELALTRCSVFLVVVTPKIKYRWNRHTHGTYLLRVRDCLRDHHIQFSYDLYNMYLYLLIAVFLFPNTIFRSFSCIVFRLWDSVKELVMNFMNIVDASISQRTVNRRAFIH